MGLEHVQKLEDIRVEQEKASTVLLNFRSTTRASMTLEAVKEFKAYLTSNKFTVSEADTGFGSNSGRVITALYQKNLSFVLRLPDTTQNVIGGGRLTLEVKDGGANTRTFSIAMSPPIDDSQSRNSFFPNEQLSNEKKIEKAENELKSLQELLTSEKGKTWLFYCKEQVNNSHNRVQRGQAEPFSKAVETFTELLTAVEKEVFGE